MEPGVYLCRADPSDAAELAGLEAELETHPWTQGQFFEELAAEGVGRVLVLRRSDTSGIVGFIVVHVVADEGCVRSLGIAHSFQRRGLARFLLRVGSRLVLGQGVATLHLEVRAGNAPARSLYAAEGFVEVGRRRDYYSAPVEDAVLMSLPLRCDGADLR